VGIIHRRIQCRRQQISGPSQELPVMLLKHRPHTGENCRAHGETSEYTATRNILRRSRAGLRFDITNLHKLSREGSRNQYLITSYKGWVAVMRSPGLFEVVASIRSSFANHSTLDDSGETKKCFTERETYVLNITQIMLTSVRPKNHKQESNDRHSKT